MIPLCKIFFFIHALFYLIGNVGSSASCLTCVSNVMLFLIHLHALSF